MARTTTFYQFTPITKAKWERLARRVALLAAEKGRDRTWTKDEVLEHISAITKEDGEELDDRRLGMYLERMRMASVFSGPEVPTLDLVSLNDGNGMGYYWIRDGRIPAGFLRHVLSIAGAVPRLAFDYFILMAKEYSLEELIGAVEPSRAMLLLLLAEFYVRVKRVDEIEEDHLQAYLDQIAKFKAEVQSRITRAEAQGFNTMAEGLLLTTGK